MVVRCCVQNENGKILLIRRRSDDRFNPGRWEFPGGKVDEGEDLSNTQSREIKEEAGLTVELVNPLVCVQSKIVGEKKEPYDGDTYVEMCGLATLLEGPVQLSNDHTEFAWVKPGVADEEYDLSPETEKLLKVLKNNLL